MFVAPTREESNGPSTTTTTTTKLSFGLNTVKSHQLARRAAPTTLTATASAATAIKAVAADGSTIPSVNVPKQGPLIVPLLDSNGRPDNDLAVAAATALLRGDGIGNGNSATSTGANVAAIPVVPLLVRGRLDGVESAGDDTSQYRSDVALRPDAPSLDAYAAMPVDAIGKAMLLGMGWVEGGGVGRKRQVFEPVDLARRPERLGLGAKADDEKLPPTHKKRSAGAPADASTASTSAAAATAASSSSAPRTFAVGVVVAIVGGRHEGVSGRIEELVGDKQLLVRLASDELVTIKRKYAELRADNAGAAATTSSKKRSSSAPSDNSNQNNNAAAAVDGAPKRARKAAEPPAEIWVRPNIMVRIVSKKFRDGKFYEKKARVLDCVGGELCVVELTDGRVLDDVTQSVLENVVGRVGNRVQVLRGERAGALGVVLERNADKQVALVQLDADPSKPHQFAYDDIALYATASEQE
jgi:G patch domain/KOW motif-containing protein